MNEVRQEIDDLPESARYLVGLAVAPLIWFAHFLVTYVAVSVWCAKVAGPDGRLDSLHTYIVAGTAAAIIAITFLGVSGFRRHRYGTETLPHDFDSPSDRHRFLGWATLLLAGLSAFATFLVAAHALYFDTCR
jgi:hypothetical protein